MALTKRLVNERWAPPTEGELLQSFRAISDAITWPQAQARMHLLAGRGWGTDTDVELNHADLVGNLGPELAHQQRPIAADDADGQESERHIRSGRDAESPTARYGRRGFRSTWNYLMTTRTSSSSDVPDVLVATAIALIGAICALSFAVIASPFAAIRPTSFWTSM